MKKVLISIALVCTVLFGIIITNSFLTQNKAKAAADNCTEWMLQNNGCYERVCARDSDGQMYCQQSCDGQVSNIYCQ